MFEALNEVLRRFIGLNLATKYYGYPDDRYIAFMYLYNLGENPFIPEDFRTRVREINNVESFRTFLEDTSKITKLIDPKIAKIYNTVCLQASQITGIYNPESYLQELSKADDSILSQILKQYREKILPKTKEIVELSNGERQKFIEEIGERDYKRKFIREFLPDENPEKIMELDRDDLISIYIEKRVQKALSSGEAVSREVLEKEFDEKLKNMKDREKKKKFREKSDF